MTQSKPKKSVAKEKSAKPKPWTIERIIALIEKNGGPQGLDLSGKNLFQIDLSAEAVAKQLEKRGYQPGDSLPVWASRLTTRTVLGLCLKGMNLKGARLRLANLHGADLSQAILEEADLRDTNMQSVDLFQADLRHARLWRADLRRASAVNANLREASLFKAEFDDTVFLEADLKDTLIHRTDLSKVVVRRDSFPNRLIYERPKDYEALLKWDYPDLVRDKNEWERQYIRHLERGRDAYRGLKSSFLNNGMYQDAGWAYFRERVVDRQMHSLNQCRLYFGEHVADRKWYAPRILWLYVKHFLIWLGLWLEELTCGYGEKPLRALGFAVTIILAFWPLYALSNGIASRSGDPMGWLDFLVYSMSTFATVNLPRFDVSNTVAELLTSLEALFGIAVLALLMFTLGNRISRS